MLRHPLAARRAAALTAALTMTLVACGSSDDDASGGSVVDVTLVPATQASVPAVQLPEATPTELVKTRLVPGTGAAAAAGDTVLVNYVGVRAATGEQFDTNFGDEPLPVTVGAGNVIEGWDQGLVGVTTGERIQLDIPSDLAYKDQPRGAVIQAGDALSFVIDVQAVVPAVDPALEPTAQEIPTSADAATAVETDDVRPGDGTSLEAGMTGVFHLVLARRDNGTVLQSTWDAMQPQPLAITDDLLPGLAEGLTGMQVGGRRLITLPYDSALGLTPETDVIVVADLLAAY
jgi:peptidylprolyl isomerase